MSENAFNSWALVELFGHQQISGLVSEQRIAGAAFVRVDVPAVKDVPAYTKFFFPSAIYGITPCEEEAARRACEYLRIRPIQTHMIAAPATISMDGNDPDSDRGYDDDDEGGEE